MYTHIFWFKFDRDLLSVWNTQAYLLIVISTVLNRQYDAG